MDLPSEANRAFSLLSPKTCCPHQHPASVPQPHSCLLLPYLALPTESQSAPSRGGRSLAGLSNRGLSYLQPWSPKPAETATPRPSHSESYKSLSWVLSKGSVPSSFPPTICPGFPVTAPRALQSGERFQPGFNYRERSCCWPIYIYLQDLTN